MKLTLLGTGNALVTECYNTCFVISDENKHFMVDGGGGNTILAQLKKAGFNWKDMRHIFVTHKHLDHLIGIIWLVRMICQNIRGEKYEGDAYIYSHKEVLDLIRQLSTMLIRKQDVAYLDDRIHLVEVNDGEVLNINDRKFTFFDIGSTKAKQYGFTMELDNGEKLTCCGDEPFYDREFEYANNSRWLLHEAFCLYSEKDIFNPYEKNHSTVKDACETARKLNVKNLVLYHTEDNCIEDRKTLYTEEGKKYFDGKIFVPNDLEVIEID